MSKEAKKIEAETKFAEAVYREFKERRFGITPCCYADLMDSKIKRDICNWQALLDYQAITTCGDGCHCASSTNCSCSCNQANFTVICDFDDPHIVDKRS